MSCTLPSPPNNGVEYEVGEVMAADRHGHVMTYGGELDSADFFYYSYIPTW